MTLLNESNVDAIVIKSLYSMSCFVVDCKLMLIHSLTLPQFSDANYTFALLETTVLHELCMITPVIYGLQ